MIKPIKRKRPQKVKQKVQNVLVLEAKTRISNFWWPLPYDKKERSIPSSVDCLFSKDYYSREQAKEMLRSM